MQIAQREPIRPHLHEEDVDVAKPPDSESGHINRNGTAHKLGTKGKERVDFHQAKEGSRNQKAIEIHRAMS